MTLKVYLWGIRISTILALLAWGAILYYVDPEKTGIFGQVLFYGSLFLALSGIFILFFTWVRRKINKEESFVYIGMSFRQGVLLALLVVILLVMLSLGILVWWDGLLVVAALFLIELYFLFR